MELDPRPGECRHSCHHWTEGEIGPSMMCGIMNLSFKLRNGCSTLLGAEGSSKALLVDRPKKVHYFHPPEKAGPGLMDGRELFVFSL